MTPMMMADEIAKAFNAAGEREYWKATIGGTKGLTQVYFNSRSSMVKVTYTIQTGQFSVAFSKVQCAFGDFMHSSRRALEQVLLALKASGHKVAAPLDEGALLRCEYDPLTKDTTISLARTGDDWLDTDPASFKVLQKSL